MARRKNIKDAGDEAYLIRQKPVEARAIGGTRLNSPRHKLASSFLLITGTVYIYIISYG